MGGQARQKVRLDPKITFPTRLHLNDDLYQWESLLETHAEKTILLLNEVPDMLPTYSIFRAPLVQHMANVRNSDINALILDYLTMEGYPKAAENFCKEANMEPQDDGDGIDQRWSVRQYILQGDYTSAIVMLNDIDLEVRFEHAHTPLPI